jgi:hypothetical protein
MVGQRKNRMTERLVRGRTARELWPSNITGGCRGVTSVAAACCSRVVTDKGRRRGLTDHRKNERGRERPREEVPLPRLEASASMKNVGSPQRTRRREGDNVEKENNGWERREKKKRFSGFRRRILQVRKLPKWWEKNYLLKFKKGIKI